MSNTVEIKFKCEHENVIFIEEYCKRNCVTMDGFLDHCVNIIKSKSEFETESENKKVKKKQASL
jgi:hypothetical protein